MRDHGAGIPPAELQRIFGAFVQSSSSKDGSSGTGLGLAICKKILDAHDGTTTAVNMLDGGAARRGAAWLAQIDPWPSRKALPDRHPLRSPCCAPRRAGRSVATLACRSSGLPGDRALGEMLVPGVTFEQLVRARAQRGKGSGITDVEAFVADRMAAHRNGEELVVRHIDGQRAIRIVDRRMSDGHRVGFSVDVTRLVQATEAAQAASQAKRRTPLGVRRFLRNEMFLSDFRGHGPAAIVQGLSHTSKRSGGNNTMPQQAVAPAEERYARYIVRSCPKCRSALQRVWRRPIDRFVSLFVPVHRFRCEKFVCQWAGNLRVRDTLGPSVQPETDNILLNPVPARVPRTFIGSMVLVAVGIVAIILVPVADLVGNDPPAYLEPSDYRLSVAPKEKEAGRKYRLHNSAGPQGH